MSECPECGKVLRGNKCACGFKSAKILKTTEEQERETYEALRCQWQGNRGQCRLPGSMSQQFGSGAKFFCHWHFECLTSSDPGISTNKEEFLAYFERVYGEKFERNKFVHRFNLSLGT